MAEVDSSLMLISIKSLYEKLPLKKDQDDKELLENITKKWMELEHNYFYTMQTLLYWHFMESGNPISEDIELINFKRGWSWYQKLDMP